MNQQELIEFRCTRNFPYRFDGCSGKTSIKVRYGHFVLAFNEQSALEEMHKRYPNDVTHYKSVGETFTVERKIA